jgi:hypothetical protein
VEGFLNVGWGDKPGFKKETISRPGFQTQKKFRKKWALLKGSQPKGDVSGKSKGMCFNYNEVGHYSKDYPNPNQAMEVLR